MWISPSTSSDIPDILLSTSNTDMKDGSGDCNVCGAAIPSVVVVLFKENRCFRLKGVRRSARNRGDGVGTLVDLASKRLSSDGENGSKFEMAVAGLLRVGLLAAIPQDVRQGGVDE